jgi:hypothetical protein
MSDKIINSFQARRQLNQAFDDLAATETEAELTRVAREIAQRFDDELILAELIRRLETPSSQLRGGLGWLAQLLPRAETTSALLAQAANRHNSPQVRVTAALLLERYFDMELPAGLVSDLDGTNEVALQSLQSAIDEGRRNRYVLFEYVTQMREADVGVGLAVIELLSQLPAEDRVDMLRLIAQDTRAAVARQAIEELIALGKSNVATEAARALYVLSQVSPPEQATLAGRGLRKLQFQGVRYVPPPATDWHALLSPVDVAGNQTAWFVHKPDNQATGALLGFIINGATGILQMFGSDTVARVVLPDTPGPGEQMLVDVGNTQPLLMLEGPVSVAQQLVERSLSAHWRVPDAAPLSGEFELLNDLLWQHDPQAETLSLSHYFEEAESDEGPTDASATMALADELQQNATELLHQPAMLAWVFQFRNMLEAMGIDLAAFAASPGDMPALEAATLSVLQRLAAQETAYGIEQAGLRNTLAHALRSQAVWFELANQPESAKHALHLATHMSTFPLQENALLTALTAGALHQISQAQ